MTKKNDQDATKVEHVPPHETTASPVNVSVAAPHYFGVTPPMLVFALATASLALAIAFALLAHWVAALLLAVVSLVLLALFVGVARRKPDTELARVSARAIDRARERMGWMLEVVAVRSSAGRELSRLRNEILRLVAERDSRLRDLGAAVYDEDDEARQKLTDEIRRLDEAAKEKEGEMQAIAEAAQEHIQRGRLSVQPTLIEAAAPVPVPEPYPPPDEGTPPQQPLIPEPSPPPDEGTPPSPDPVPPDDR
jgi:membrane protein implicated in regulation of membrane protease activity